MNKIDLIREKCISANPEIVELRPGQCAIHFPDCALSCPSRVTQKVMRPIRLADVLLAINENVFPRPELQLMSVELDISKSDSNGRNNCLWNLLKDDLTQQNEDTINFLYELLSVKE